MAYQIRELRLGGILDQGIAVVKDNFGLLFGILLCAWIPFQGLVAGVQLALLPSVPPDPTMEDLSRVLDAQVEHWSTFALLFAVMYLVVLPLTNAAVIYAVAQRYLGNTVSIGEAIGKGASKILPLIGTTILAMLAIMGGLLLCVVPGILFALWFGLSQHVVVLEDKSGATALGRSKTIVRPYLGTFLVLGILVGIISALISVGAEYIPQRHLSLVAAILLQSAVTLISTSVFVVFYFSCRSGVENFDLEHLAAAVGSSASSQDVMRDFEEEF